MRNFPGYNLPPGASISVSIEVSLSPGLAANTVSTNTAGATSPTTPNLACDGTSVVGGVFGEGTYCTASATITSQGGAAFDARKWVSGNPALGWYNTATKARVPTGDAACPSLVVAQTVYTIYPCVALVNPGDRFDYVLRFVNAGTEPATVARLIDRLPVQGDTGVILPRQRGTEWANRPTMAGPPTVLQAPAGLATTQVLYTNGAVCNADLTLSGPGCPATDWDDSFGPDNTGFQMRFTFANPTYQPGDVMLIGFAMTTPLEVPYSSDPTIAWNSFAHSETTANGTNLPPTEPLQVGIATAYGNLQVQKKIGQNPFDLDFSGTQFNFHYTCTSTPQGGSPTQVADGNVLATPLIPGLVEHLPAGATCRVWETDSVGGTPLGDGSSEADPVVVDITWDPAEDAPIPTATITNDYPAGQVTVTKAVTGAAAGEFGTGPFTVGLSCVYPDGRVVAVDPLLTFTGNGTSAPVSAPVGSTCTATEPEGGRGGAWSSTIDPVDGVLVTPESVSTPIDISVINDFPNGTLQIVKELAGPGAPSYGDGPFIFDVSCSFNGNDTAFTGQVSLTRTDPNATSVSGQAGPIPAGALCSVSESNNGGADGTPDPIGSVRILPDGSDGSPVTVSFTNVFSKGSLSLTKTVSGAGADADYAAGPFTFQVTCLRTVTGPDGDPLQTTVPLPDGGVLQVGPGETATVSTNLPLGARCYAEETESAGATSESIDHGTIDDAVVVEPAPEGADTPAPVSIAATNTFDVGSLVISKVVDGTGAAAILAAGKKFGLTVSCELPTTAGDPIALPDQQVTLEGGQSTTLTDLPVGAQCWATEPDALGADATEIDSDSAASAATVVADADGVTPASITATNTFITPLDSLVVTKKLAGAGAAAEIAAGTEFGIVLSCSVPSPTGGDPAALADKELNVPGDGSVTVTDIPVGAKCWASEPDAGGASATVIDFDSAGSAATVVASGDAVAPAAITVTNTFDGEPVVGGVGGVGGVGIIAIGGTGGSSGSPGGGSSSGSGSIAYTGVDLQGLLTLAVLLLLAGGAAVVVAGKRRRAGRRG